MTIKEIIRVLQTMPQDAQMGHLWDGAVRSTVDVVYLAQDGTVVGAPKDEPAYYDEDRPFGAPSKNEDPYWKPGEILTPTKTDKQAEV